MQRGVIFWTKRFPDSAEPLRPARAAGRLRPVPKRTDQAALRSADKERQPMPVALDEERPMPDARRTVAGRSEG
jgi:hypothetical protein